MTDKEIGKIAFNKFGLQECDEDYTYFVLGYKEAIKKQFAITDVVSCVCKMPEPRLKVSENGTHAYCNNCAKTYLQK
tara:strand:+ start:399 stop:629 length:231 start_codon:yes stop_codon:yes gene_type:complete